MYVKPEKKTKWGGFFVNSGAIELVSDEGAEDEEKDKPKASTNTTLKTSRSVRSHDGARITLEPEIEAAIKKLQDVTPSK